MGKRSKPIMDRTGHWWSGWPGASCAYCDSEDVRETCVAVHDVLLRCMEGHVECFKHSSGLECTEHPRTECPANPVVDVVEEGKHE